MHHGFYFFEPLKKDLFCKKTVSACCHSGLFWVLLEMVHFHMSGILAGWKRHSAPSRIRDAKMSEQKVPRDHVRAVSPGRSYLQLQTINKCVSNNTAIRSGFKKTIKTQQPKKSKKSSWKSPTIFPEKSLAWHQRCQAFGADLIRDSLSI